MPSSPNTVAAPGGGLADALQQALALLWAGDGALWSIVGLSLQVSLSAVLCAALLGLPLGAAIAVGRFPGRTVLIVLLNALMGLPPVVAGLLVYLLLSRAGPLGALGILFTPSAMVLAQTLLIIPIIAALSRQVGLGMVLMTLVLLLNALAQCLKTLAERRYG